MVRPPAVAALLASPTLMDFSAGRLRMPRRPMPVWFTTKLRTASRHCNEGGGFVGKQG